MTEDEFETSWSVITGGAGSAGSATSAGSKERGTGTGTVLDEVREWCARFISTVADDDLDLLTLWAAHTHLCEETYTSPRLLLDSPVPGSGKTTVLEHLDRLCVRPVQMAALSSPALITRMLEAGIRTVLIDEADRSLSADKEGVGELLAVLNSGYKRGGTRPVLVPVKGGGWDAKEMPTFAPVAMAGNNPNLPDDTKSRCIRVLLMPDVDGSIEDSDWEDHDGPARALGTLLGCWADDVREFVRTTKPELPDGVRGRSRERWGPLKRVALAVGGRWPELVDKLAVQDMQRIEAEKDEGLIRQRPHVVLLSHLAEIWQPTETFVSTTQLITRLIAHHPDVWGSASPYGKALTPQRLGRMLVTSYNIHSSRLEKDGPRGYLRVTLEPVLRRFGVPLPSEPALLAEPVQPARPAQPAQPAGPSCEMCGQTFAGVPGEPLCPSCDADARAAS